MTPFIQETVGWMSEGVDPTEFQWFDMTNLMSPNERIENDWIKKYRPPFPKCMVIANMQGRKIYLMVLGDDPLEGIIIKTLVSIEDRKPVWFPSMVYLLDNDIVRYGPAEEKVKIKDEFAELTLAFINGWYGALSKGGVAHIPKIKNTFTNRRKIAQGKKPMYEWTTVVIGLQKAKLEHQGGTHASPRLHDRRGHLRRLRNGNQVWVRSCKVGKPELGTVFHDYEVIA